MTEAKRRPGATGSPLTDAQLRAAQLILQGCRVQEVADGVGIDRTTLWKWRQDPVFQAHLDAERETIAATYRERLHHAGETAITAMVDLITDPEAPHSVRLQAAREVLSRIGLAERREVDVRDDRVVESFRAALSGSSDEMVDWLREAVSGGDDG